ncbi:MAG TPA: hypothetical protein VKB80_27375 [Kofleriaceae bacterium]|nr:hypothetical protein [Kofleriaceae bacterium]
MASVRRAALTLPALLALLALFIGPAACGKAVEDGDAADAAADDGGDVDAGDDDGGDAGADAATDDASPRDTRGLVRIFARNYTDAGDNLILSSTVTAGFGAYEDEDCAVELAGTECQVLACTERDPERPAPHAGAITVEALQEVVLMPGSDGAYAPREVDTVVFSDGGMLSVLAVGGDVPAFDVTDMVAPYPIGFQSGVPTSAGPVKLSAAADYALTWGGIEATDTVRIVLAGPRDGDGTRRLVSCSLGAGAGAVTIDSEKLQRLPVGDIAFEATTERSETIEAGDYTISVIAAVVARLGDDASGDWAAGTVLLGD